MPALSAAASFIISAASAIYFRQLSFSPLDIAAFIFSSKRFYFTPAIFASRFSFAAAAIFLHFF
jgi:hypothetical protein